ncbi:MAG: GtrA family protein [Coprobacter sp.]|nr:GtrA family protein [Coprobacter sp.]
MMKNKRWDDSEVLRFCITGAAATGVLYGLYFPLCRIMNVNAAYSIAFGVSFVSNFLLSNYYTFRTRPTWKGSVRFAGSHVVNYLMQIGCLNFFIWLGVPKEAAPIPVWAVIMPVNFLMVRFALRGPARRKDGGVEG